MYHNVSVAGDPAKKRSKLILPAPQVSDTEIDEVVKLGGASPMVGGVMTPLIGLGGDSTLRGGMTPGQTPRQTPRQTPFQGATAAMTPSRTPVRDQLSINVETPGEMYEDMRQQQLEIQAQLRAGLGSLPAPKNDFELVAPEDADDQDADIGMAARGEEGVEDAADVEERRENENKERGVSMCKEVCSLP